MEKVILTTLLVCSIGSVSAQSLNTPPEDFNHYEHHRKSNGSWSLLYTIDRQISVDGRPLRSDGYAHYYYAELSAFGEYIRWFYGGDTLVDSILVLKEDFLGQDSVRNWGVYFEYDGSRKTEELHLNFNPITGESEVSSLETWSYREDGGVDAHTYYSPAIGGTSFTDYFYDGSGVRTGYFNFLISPNNDSTLTRIISYSYDQIGQKIKDVTQVIDGTTGDTNLYIRKYSFNGEGLSDTLSTRARLDGEWTHTNRTAFVYNGERLDSLYYTNNKRLDSSFALVGEVGYTYNDRGQITLEHYVEHSTSLREDRYEWTYPEYPVGNEEAAENEQLVELFPNPAHERVTLRNVEEPMEATVIDAFGKVVMVVQVDPLESSLPVKGLSQGTYWILLHDRNGSQTPVPFIKL